MMRSILFFLLLVGSFHIASSQAVVYYEDFSGEGNNATSGTASGTPGGTWSVTTTPSGGSGSFSKQSHGFNERFTIDDTGNEGVWKTNTINITGLGNVGLDIALVTFYANSTDYVRAYYVLNGGPEVLFGELYGGSYSVSANASVVLSGTSLQIVVRGKETNGGSTLFTPHMMRFDDVTVTQIGTLYSRQTGNWSSGTTWSTTGHAGSSCSCTPGTTTSVEIGNAHTVDVNATGNAVNISINNGGTLHFAASNELNVARGGSINIANGGSMTTNNTSNQLNFDYQATNNIVVNGSMTIGDLDINAPATLNISGSGSLTVTDDILIGSTASIVNTMSSSGVTVQDFVEFEAAAAGGSIVNSGVFSINNVLLFNDVNATVTNSGTLSITSALRANGNTDDNNAVINTVTGTLNVGTITPNDGSMIITNNGTINQAGNFTTLDATSVFTNAATGTWNWSYVFGTANDAELTSVLNCTAVGNTFRYNGGGSQTIALVPYHHLSLSNSGAKRILGNLDVNGNLSADAVTLNTNSNTINLAGDYVFINSAPFTEGTGTVIFDGSSDQTILKSSGEIFNNLTIDKSGGTLILDAATSSSITVNGALTLTRGIVLTSSTSPLIVGSTGTSSTGSSLSFVDGPMRKIGNNVDPFVFPVGDGNVWARIGVDYATISGTPTFEAQYFDAAYSTFDTDGSMDNVSGKEYWVLNRIASATTAKVQLFWESSTRSEIDDITTTDLVVAHYNGTKWTSLGRSSISGMPITTGNLTSSTTLSSFSPFTFGSLTLQSNPLPITLDYFTATTNSTNVVLQWKTLSEQDNKNFVVERSTNAEDFYAIASIDGHGTTNQSHRYQSIDSDPIIGKAYYRLKQIDLDGTATYSEIRVVSFEAEVTQTFSLTIFPNPLRNKVLAFELVQVKREIALPVDVLDTRGKLVFQKTIFVRPGEIKHEVALPEALPPGLYFLRMGYPSSVIRKFLIE